MGTRVGRTVIVAVAFGMLLLVGNFALSYSNTKQLHAESARVLHSNEILLALDNVLTLAKDASQANAATSSPAGRVPDSLSDGSGHDSHAAMLSLGWSPGIRSWRRCWSRCGGVSAPSSASSR